MRLFAVTVCAMLATLWLGSNRVVAQTTCFTVVVIDAKGGISQPGPVPCESGKRIRWKVHNLSTEEVVVSFVNFKKGTDDVEGPPDPLTEAVPPVNVKAGDDEETKKIKLKDPAQFGGVTVRYTYDIKVAKPTGEDLDMLDPDLEVTPPPGGIKGGRGRGRGGRNGGSN